MDFLKLAKKRYSTRSFTTEKIKTEKIDLILKAGQISPTAANLQSQRIIVINSADGLEKVKQCTPYDFNAQLNFLICYDNNSCWTRPFDQEKTGYIDASIVATHMMLQITSMGLGSTWVGYFDPEVVKKVFNLSENIIPIAFLPTGYPSPDAKPSPKHEERLPINKTVSTFK